MRNYKIKTKQFLAINMLLIYSAINAFADAEQSSERIYNQPWDSIDNISGNFYNLSDENAGGAIYNIFKAKSTNDLIFEGNKAVYGGAIYNYFHFGYEAYVEDYGYAAKLELFGANTFQYNEAGLGGAIYNSYGEIVLGDGSLFYSNTATGGGGAILNDGGTIEMTNTTFTNNTAVSGGAIQSSNSSSIVFNVTKNLEYLGNVATGNTDDPFSDLDLNGGFMTLIDSAKATFNVSANATLTIGDGTYGQDSISSYNCEGDAYYSTDAVINKTGAGTLTVNSSMEHYHGTLNVTEGTMNVNNILGATTIDIDSGATLALTINGSNTLSSTSLSYTNDGTLQLIAGVSLDAGSYSISASSVTDFGSVVTYGGTYANGEFTMGSVETVTVAGDVATLTDASISSNSNIKIVKDTQTDIVDVMLSFDLIENSSISVTSAEDVTDSTSIGELTTLLAWDFEIKLDEGDTVVLTYYIGSVEDSSLLALYHIDGSTITDESDSIISYDGEYIVFEVDSFSIWAVTTVPEPSTYAMIFGALALGLAVYRRRK